MKLFGIVFYMLLSFTGTAQRGMLLVQKKGKTVASFATSSDVTIVSKYGQYTKGLLARVKKDSFSILQYRIQRRGDLMGFITFDTIYNGYVFFHKDDVKSITRRKPKGTGFKILGGIGVLGGGAMSVLNLVNGRRFGYKTFTDYIKPIALKGLLPMALGLGVGKLYKEEFVIRNKWGIALLEY